MSTLRLLTIITLAASLLSCATQPAEPSAAPSSGEKQTEETAVEAPRCDDIVRLEPSQPIAQVSWMMTGADTTHIDYRIPAGTNGEWTSWRPVELTFREGDAYNARVVLDTPADTIELRGGDELHNAQFSLQSHPTARRPALDEHSAQRPEIARACSENDIYLVAAGDDDQTHRPPNDLVVPREKWGAIAPDRVCRKIADPYRITFHHTFVPDAGDDPARATRQIQSFHLNERGWCDIGYHFLIGADGRIFEGSAVPHRLAAHVGDENEGNVGIAFIGDYTDQKPTDAQTRAAVELVDWLHHTYDIELSRQAIRGHGEWPGQSTACPGDGLRPLIDEIVHFAER